MEKECGSCGCGNKMSNSECCSSDGCGCNSPEQSCGKCDKMEMFMEVAKTAKSELLREKIKKRLEVVMGKKLDKVAELLVEAMIDHYKSEMEQENKEQDFRQRFEAIFSEP